MKVHNVSQDNNAEEDVDNVLTVKKEELSSINSKGPIYVKMDIKNYGTVKFQVDCGATVNMIPKKFIVNQPLSQSNTSLQMYNKSTLKPLGKQD